MLPINELQLATMRAKFVGISNAQHRQTNLWYFKIYTSDNYRNHPTYHTTATGNNEKKNNNIEFAILKNRISQKCILAIANCFYDQLLSFCHRICCLL